MGGMEVPMVGMEVPMVAMEVETNSLLATVTLLSVLHYYYYYVVHVHSTAFETDSRMRRMPRGAIS